LDRIKALLESGDVERLHTVPHHRPYTVAQHCWRAAVLLDTLYPAASTALRRAVLFHDSAERWTGDMPATAKWWIAPEAGRAVGRAEDKIKQQLDLEFGLTVMERNWLKAVDLLELYLYCLDERNLGNQNLGQCEVACWEILTEGEKIPDPVRKWVDNLKEWKRTDDNFGMRP
jgi:5'-deoxynucleotidase YfbR-like HD superfamily hydrolase